MSGIFVIETDTADGHGEGTDGAAALARLEAEHGPLPPTLEAESPSGSIHRYYKYPGFKIKNSASLIGPGIDVRGDGGMVVAPPSIKPGKGVYVWRNRLPVADAPQWMLDRIVGGKEKSESTLSISQQAVAMVRPPVNAFTEYGASSRITGVDIGARFSRAYLDKALDGERAVVASSSEGARNAQLNDSSFALGQLVAHGLSEKEVIDTMYDAAMDCGYVADDGRAATMATINSGLKAGIANPRTLPQAKTPGDPTGGNVVPINGANASKPAPTGMPLTFFDNVENFAKKNWLMKGVIAKRETSMWIAPPGRLKSALMTDLAIHLASGMDWRRYQSKETCGVVYFALERADLVKRRLAAHRKVTD
jgi:Bifunctional DNA primase/polymerase, N-terminal/AAA domain